MDLGVSEAALDRALGITESDAAAIIAARAKAVVDRVVGECMAQVRARPKSLREARMVKKGEVRLNGR